MAGSLAALASTGVLKAGLEALKATVAAEAGMLEATKAGVGYMAVAKGVAMTAEEVRMGAG